MRILAVILQYISFDGSTVVRTELTGFSSRFYFANLVFRIAINYFIITNSNKQRISLGTIISEKTPW